MLKRGRVTPKKAAAGRYTPPVPREVKVSPMWVPVLMFTLLGLGMIVIVINYLGVLPGGADNKYLLVGLVLITGGFITATRYR
ncbi:MAG: cell division protein CrgA [Actinobacteria bacterium]|nr:cell division protein CrgA [Actinomycetota bacterium]